MKGANEKNTGHKTAKKRLKFKCQGDETTDCIICGENFNEDWIQCNVCKGWAHENCANLEGNARFYKCDRCKAK